VIAPPQAAAKNECLLLTLSGDQVDRLVRILERGSAALESLDSE
jgi:hypothetical protein